MKFYQIIEYRSPDEIYPWAVFSTELKAWLYLAQTGRLYDKRFRVVPYEIDDNF